MRGSTLAACATCVISVLSRRSQPRRAASFAAIGAPPLPYSRATVTTRYITDRMHREGKVLQAETQVGRPVLLDFAGSGVAGLRDDLVLDRLVILDDAQRLAVLRIYKLNLDLAELAVADLVAWMIGQRILVPQGLMDGAINLRKL